MRSIGRFSLLALAFCMGHAIAQDSPEPGSAEEIAKATTSPQFLSPWVASLPASSSVPSPRAFLKRIRRRAGRAGRFRDGVRLRARPRRGFAARRDLHDRPLGGRARHRAAGDCGRARHPDARSAEARHCRAGRSAQDGSGGSRADRRARTADLLFQRLPACGRNRLHGIRAGAGLPAGRLGAADDPAHAPEPGRADQPGVEPRWARQSRRMVLSLPQRQDRSQHAAAPVAAVLVEVRVRGHQSRRASARARRKHARSRACSSSGIPPSCTTCTRASRCSCRGTAPGRTTRTSIRSRSPSSRR